MSEEFVAYALLEFSDGTGATKVLREGTIDACQRAADDAPAATYSGPKIPLRARVGVMPKREWERINRL